MSSRPENAPKPRRLVSHSRRTPIALLATSLLMLADCCNLNADRLPRGSQPTETPRAKPTSTATPTQGNTAEPSALSGASTIDCGPNKCQVGTEICCSYYGKNHHVCKAAPARPIGDALLNACGARDGLSAMACDDSGDCAGNMICVMPVRWGTDVRYSTQECLAPNDTYASEVERCGKGGVCKRKGMKCGSQGFCKM
jgi:hypothetical protein